MLTSDDRPWVGCATVRNSRCSSQEGATVLSPDQELSCRSETAQRSASIIGNLAKLILGHISVDRPNNDASYRKHIANLQLIADSWFGSVSVCLSVAIYSIAKMHRPSSDMNEITPRRWLRVTYRRRSVVMEEGDHCPPSCAVNKVGPANFISTDQNSCKQ